MTVMMGTTTPFMKSVFIVLRLFSAANLDAGQHLVILCDGTVVRLTLAVIMQPLQNFLYLSSHGDRCADRVRAVQSIVQILDVQ